MQLRSVPGARVIGATAPTGGDAAALAAAVGGGGLPGGDVINAPWCDRITLHEPAAMVLAMFEVGGGGGRESWAE